jgi:hypothetical protein
MAWRETNGVHFVFGLTQNDRLNLAQLDQTHIARRKCPWIARLTRAAASRCSHAASSQAHRDRFFAASAAQIPHSPRHPQACPQHQKHGDQIIRPIAHWYGEIYGLNQVEWVLHGLLRPPHRVPAGKRTRDYNL